MFDSTRKRLVISCVSIDNVILQFDISKKKFAKWERSRFEKNLFFK